MVKRYGPTILILLVVILIAVVFMSPAYKSHTPINTIHRTYAPGILLQPSYPVTNEHGYLMSSFTIDDITIVTMGDYIDSEQQREIVRYSTIDKVFEAGNVEYAFYIDFPTIAGDSYLEIPIVMGNASNSHVFVNNDEMYVSVASSTILVARVTHSGVVTIYSY